MGGLEERIRKASPDEPLLQVHPTIARRVIGIGSMFALGALILWAGLTGGGDPLAKLVLTAVGLLMIGIGAIFVRATSTGLELTKTEVREIDTKRILFQIENVTNVERGFRVLKPTNGLLVELSEPAKRAYVPGLWWRWHRTVGIGGMTNAGQGKALAEFLKLMIVSRDENGP